MCCLHVRLPDALLGDRVQRDPQADILAVVKAELVERQGRNVGV
jgi:hypothetical protein